MVVFAVAQWSARLQLFSGARLFGPLMVCLECGEHIGKEGEAAAEDACGREERRDWFRLLSANTASCSSTCCRAMPRTKSPSQLMTQKAQ